MISLKNLLLVPFSLAIWLSPVFAQQTIHVPADAHSIQAGIEAAHNGDTVLVSPGTYNENIDFKGKAITVTSGAKSFTDPAAVATIINGTSDGPVVVFATNEPVAATLNGFTVQNGHSSAASGLNGGGISISGSLPTITNNVVANNIGCGILVFNGASPLIQGNDIKGTTSTPSDKPQDSRCNGTASGVGTPSGVGLGIIYAGSVQVIGNTIEDNIVQPPTNGSASELGGGVEIIGSVEILLENNIIRNNHAQGSPGIFEALGSPSAKLVLIQNLIYGNTNIFGSNDGEYSVYISGAYQAPYPSVVEINNTIYGDGQMFELGFASSTIANNIFFNTSTSTFLNGGLLPAGVWCGGGYPYYPYPTLIHNDIFNAGTLLSSDCPLGTGNLSVDPEFLNPSTGDFHTQPISPIVAAGDIDAPNIPPADLDGKARTVDGTIDMGVYEICPHPPILLTVSPNPAPGQSTVTLTAAVTGDQATPTGSITFLDGSTVLGTAALNGRALATFSTSFLFVGTHVLTATYAGDFNFENSTSNTVTEVITGPPTKTVLNSVSPNPASAFQAITLTATVSSAFGAPSGTVTFMAGSSVLGTAALNGGGIATATVSTLGAGNYNIIAVYGGSTTFAGSTSAPVLETVVGTNTATSLTATPNPVIFGQTVMLIAIVAATRGSGVPSGAVMFLDGTQVLGSTILTAKGAVTFNTSSLGLGMHTITASYAGSPNADASVSIPVNVLVEPIPTSLGLSGAPNPANFGQTVTFTATVAAAGTVPGGTVTFFDQGKTLGSTALNASGVAAFTLSTLTAGPHQITATISPTGPYVASSSAPLTEVILNYDFSLSASSTSLKIPSGGYQVLSVTVTPIGGFPGTVALGCSSLPAHTLCNFNPSTSPPLMSGAQTVQFTLNTSDVLGYGQQVGNLVFPGKHSGGGNSSRLAGILFPLMMFCGLMGAARRGGDLRLRRLLLIVVISSLTLSLAACSGKLPGQTPPGTYTISVTGTDTDPTSSIVHTTNVRLVVTP